MMQNAGMIERGGGASFAEEAFKRLRIAAGIFGEEFQRDAPAKLGVLSFVDDTLPRCQVCGGYGSGRLFR